MKCASEFQKILDFRLTHLDNYGLFKAFTFHVRVSIEGMATVLVSNARQTIYITDAKAISYIFGQFYV